MDKIAIALLGLFAATAAQAQTLPQLPTATTPLTGSELMYVVQGGVSKQVPSGSLPFNISALLNQSVNLGTGSLTANGGINTTGGGSLAGTFTGSSTFSGNLSLTGSGTALAVTNNATIGGTFGATGAATFGTLTASSLAVPNNAVGGGTPSYFLSVSGHLSAAITANGNVGWNGITVANDSADDSGTSPNVIDFFDQHNYGGTSFAGGRTGLGIVFTQNNAITSTPAGTVLSGLIATMKANNSWGGTNLYSGAVGALNGINPSIQFQAGATDMVGGSGIEVNYSAASGASLQHFNYVQAVALANHVTGATIEEAAYQFGTQVGGAATASAGLMIGGRSGYWPLSSSRGEAVYLELSNDYTTSPSTLYRGTDYLLGNISDAAFLSQGVRIDGQTGAIRSGTCYLTPASTGASLDCTGSVGTAVTLAAGGSAWPTDGNTYYATDSNDGVYKLTLSGGAVTAVSIYRAPYVSGATPSNPVTLTPDAMAATWGATGLTVNLTWSARATLALSPTSGGDTTIGGVISSLSATTGFIGLPSTAGIPTGAPAAVDCEIDTTNGYLNCYYGAAWHKIAFGSGAG